MKKRFLLIAALAAILVSCGTIQPVKPTAVEKCDIENVGTRKFLEEVDYAADTAYTVSFALHYMQEYGANDKPLPVRIASTEASDSIAPLFPVNVPPLKMSSYA